MISKNPDDYPSGRAAHQGRPHRPRAPFRVQFPAYLSGLTAGSLAGLMIDEGWWVMIALTTAAACQLTASILWRHRNRS